VPHLNDKGRGDELVTVKVATPESLTKEQRALFEQLARSLGPPRGDRGHKG
jgi:molecular chaperone DnaJ